MHWACCKTTDLTEEDLLCVYRQLSPSRKARIDRLRRKEDADRSLAAEHLVYDLLQKHWGIRTAKLHCKDNGQPFLSGCQLQVSIAHCDRLVACAISRDPVGIDVERIRPIDLDICRHVCVPQELEYVLADRQPLKKQQCCDQAVLERFFEVWTAKEAYYKRQGTGITDLKLVNILPLQRQMYVIDDYLIQII